MPSKRRKSSSGSFVGAEGYSVRQGDMDRAYKRAWKDWHSTLSDEDKSDLAEKGIKDADTDRRMPETGKPIDEAEDLVLEGYSEGFKESEEERDYEAEKQSAILEAMRVGFANILNPRAGSTAQLEADIIALAIGYPGMGSQTEVAKRHGKGKAAISRRCVEFCKALGLPRSVYMKSESAGEKYKQTNRRKTK